MTEARRAGCVNTLNTMSHFVLSMEMIIVSHVVGVGANKGDVEKDKEGLILASSVEQGRAWLLKMIYR